MSPGILDGMRRGGKCGNSPCTSPEQPKLRVKRRWLSSSPSSTFHVLQDPVQVTQYGANKSTSLQDPEPTGQSCLESGGEGSTWNHHLAPAKPGGGMEKKEAFRVVPSYLSHRHP